MIKVAVNGYGTIGKRVADAVAAQPDMEVVGVSKTSVSAEAYIANERGYPLYIADLANKPAFDAAGIKVAGDIDAMLRAADIIVDATPGGVGAKNKSIYESLGKKAIFQGGEKHEVAGLSFNAHANYKDAIGKQFTRIVSCNTTGLIRVIHALDQAFGAERVRAVMIRRGADPGDVKRGPVDGDRPQPGHHPEPPRPDVQTVLSYINIVTLAMIVPTTFMHMHSIQMDLKKETTREAVLKVFEDHSRMGRPQGYRDQEQRPAQGVHSGPRPAQNGPLGERHLRGIGLGAQRKGILLFPGHPPGGRCHPRKHRLYPGHDGDGEGS